MFNIIGWIFFGVLVGAIARFLMPGKDPGGFLVTMGLGIAGSFVGGLLARAVGYSGPNLGAGWLLSIGGAILLLWLYRRFANQNPPIR
jgi:uncharacterized membrane protein YeaQ/YmgE (transglycosylase-associated protein family)